ncbi:myb-like protein X [Mercenaria mercenaria]|uniref:myb-like protein X n=1 Tax=Mercenaria mercenaria TaxID=6596 RepID=UPI00234E51EE|nr:myb-like protein X [Mercenaria mercenaria]
MDKDKEKNVINTTDVGKNCTVSLKYLNTLSDGLTYRLSEKTSQVKNKMKDNDSNDNANKSNSKEEHKNENAEQSEKQNDHNQDNVSDLEQQRSQVIQEEPLNLSVKGHKEGDVLDQGEKESDKDECDNDINRNKKNEEVLEVNNVTNTQDSGTATPLLDERTSEMTMLGELDIVS